MGRNPHHLIAVLWIYVGNNQRVGVHLNGFKERAMQRLHPCSALKPFKRRDLIDRFWQLPTIYNESIRKVLRSNSKGYECNSFLLKEEIWLEMFLVSFVTTLVKITPFQSITLYSSFFPFVKCVVFTEKIERNVRISSMFGVFSFLVVSSSSLYLRCTPVTKPQPN